MEHLERDSQQPRGRRQLVKRQLRLSAKPPEFELLSITTSPYDLGLELSGSVVPLDSGSLLKGRFRAPFGVFMPAMVVAVVLTLYTAFSHTTLHWTAWVGVGLVILWGLWKRYVLTRSDKQLAREMIVGLRRAIDWVETERAT